MEIPKKGTENNVEDTESEQTKDSDNITPNKENDTETDNKPPEENDTKQNPSEENTESASDAIPVHLDDLLSQIVQDTIIDSPVKTDENNSTLNVPNNKRKPPNIPPKQPPKTRRTAEPKAQKPQEESKPRIRSAPSVFLQRSSRAPPVPKQVAKKNMADQYNNCVHGDPGDYLCVDCFYNRWRSEWDFLQPIQSK
eukprot:GFUD01018854.1.p1 GENE.GFUD01018854.1~~GFUD01018854.1.p1  ORF type:complete len:196 (-),score=35.36 GFUD01018854.1:208-795(-)